MVSTTPPRSPSQPTQEIAGQEASSEAQLDIRPGAFAHISGPIKTPHLHKHMINRRAREHITLPAEVNVPDRFELFILADGEKKVTEAPDTRELHRVPPKIRSC